MGDYQMTADPNIVIRTADNAVIPTVPGNAAYEQYLKWLGQGHIADPYVAPSPTPQQQFEVQLAKGLQVNWSSSIALNATYAIDPVTQQNFIAEMVSVLANGTFGTGQTQRPWADITGAYHVFNIPQFRALASAVQNYVNALYGVQQELLMGQQVNWPNNVMNITG